MGMAIQLLPESLEYCQSPCVEESASLAVMATAWRVLPSGSEKEGPKRLATVSPVGSLLSSTTGARVGLPLAIGALFMIYDFT